MISISKIHSIIVNSRRLAPRLQGIIKKLSPHKWHEFLRTRAMMQRTHSTYRPCKWRSIWGASIQTFKRFDTSLLAIIRTKDGNFKAMIPSKLARVTLNVKWRRCITVLSTCKWKFSVECNSYSKLAELTSAILFTAIMSAKIQYHKWPKNHPECDSGNCRAKRYYLDNGLSICSDGHVQQVRKSLVWSVGLEAKKWYIRVSCKRSKVRIVEAFAPDTHPASPAILKLFTPCICNGQKPEQCLLYIFVTGQAVC